MSLELEWLKTNLKYEKMDFKRTILENIIKSLQRLVAIDNSNPSEAMECMEMLKCGCFYDTDRGEYVEDTQEYNTIKQALLKQQELPEPFKTGVDIGVIKPKHYLKWEDLDFDFDVPTTIKVKMGNTQYLLSLRISLSDVKSVVLRDNNLKPFLHLFEKEKQFFNDLRLERVEE